MSEQFNLDWDQAKTLLKQGHTVEHESFNGKAYLYMITSKKLCAAFGYGYGEYEGEPAFADTIAEVVRVDKKWYSSGQVINLGYKPDRYIQRSGWRVK